LDVREHARQLDRQMLGPTGVPVMRESVRGRGVRAVVDLQRLAGNQSVSELLSGDRQGPPSSSLAALAATGRTSAGAAAAAATTVSVQREPCIDCPDASPASVRREHDRATADSEQE
jgi:hypothetical protein